jgi:pimeloyl-ACP methyl ester carboxylesterase
MEKINGKLLAVEVHGEGDALIMVHGLAGTSNAFGPQAGVLARNFTVIRLDLEGSGRSPVTGKLSIAGYVADIMALMKARKIRSAHFVGHSMGTIVCQHLAAKSPAKVKTMVLLGPLAEPPEPGRGALRDRAKLARAEGMVPIADALVQASISAATRASRSEIAALVREFVMRQDAEGYARSCEALAAARAAASVQDQMPDPADHRRRGWRGAARGGAETGQIDQGRPRHHPSRLRPLDADRASRGRQSGVVELLFRLIRQCDLTGGPGMSRSMLKS